MQVYAKNSRHCLTDHQSKLMKLKSILTALDSSVESQAGLRAAAELAGRTGAVLKSLYIEDENWFHATKTSIVRHINRHTGETIIVDEQEITRQSRALKSRLADQVDRVCNEFNVRSIYNSARGEIDFELKQASEDADLVVIGRRGTSFHTKDELGSTALYLAEKCTTPILMWSAYRNWPSMIFGITGDSETGAEIEQWVSMLSDLLSKDARMVMAGEWSETASDEKTVSAGEQILQHSFPWQTLEEPEDVYQWSGRGLIVVHRKDRLFKTIDLKKFMIKMYNPILLI